MFCGLKFCILLSSLPIYRLCQASSQFLGSPQVKSAHSSKIYHFSSHPRFASIAKNKIQYQNVLDTNASNAIALIINVNIVYISVLIFCAVYARKSRIDTPTPFSLCQISLKTPRQASIMQAKYQIQSSSSPSVAVSSSSISTSSSSSSSPESSSESSSWFSPGMLFH